MIDADLSDTVRTCSARQQQLNHRWMIVMRCHVQGCQPVLAGDVHVSSFLDDDTRHAHHAVLRRYVKSREPFLSTDTQTDTHTDRHTPSAILNPD